MSCKSCGASKIKRGECVYCGNPIDSRHIKYIDVGNLSYTDTRKFLKSYEDFLAGKCMDVPFNRPLSDMIWTLKTSTPGRPYWG